MTKTKHYLCPKGIIYTIEPVDRPSLMEWLKFIYSKNNKSQP